MPSPTQSRWPAVEICTGGETFCELWLGSADNACSSASQRSKRVILRFVLGELVKQAVGEFVDSYQTWQTDADVATTHELVRRLELWLTDICQNEL